MTHTDSIELEISGRTHRVGNVGLEVNFEAFDRIRSLRDAAFAKSLSLCKELRGEPLQSALSLALERHQRIVTNEEVSDWLDSLEGSAFTFWCAARKFRPDLSEAEAVSLYKNLNGNQFVALAKFFAESFLGPENQNDGNNG